MTDFAIPVTFVNKRDNFDVHCTIYIPDTFGENLQEHLHILQTRLNEHFGLDYSQSEITISEQHKKSPDTQQKP
jgi:hypothetical protein